MIQIVHHLFNYVGMHLTMFNIIITIVNGCNTHTCGTLSLRCLIIINKIFVDCASYELISIFLITRYLSYSAIIILTHLIGNEHLFYPQFWTARNEIVHFTSRAISAVI